MDEDCPFNVAAHLEGVDRWANRICLFATFLVGVACGRWLIWV